MRSGFHWGVVYKSSAGGGLWALRWRQNWLIAGGRQAYQLQALRHSSGNGEKRVSFSESNQWGCWLSVGLWELPVGEVSIPWKQVNTLIRWGIVIAKLQRMELHNSNGMSSCVGRITQPWEEHKQVSSEQISTVPGALSPWKPRRALEKASCGQKVQQMLWLLLSVRSFAASIYWVPTLYQRWCWKLWHHLDNQEFSLETSLAVQWLRHLVRNGGNPSSIHSQGSRLHTPHLSVSHATEHNQNQKQTKFSLVKGWNRKQYITIMME